MALEYLALAGVLLLATAPRWVASVKRVRAAVRRWTRRRTLDRRYREERASERLHP